MRRTSKPPRSSAPAPLAAAALLLVASCGPDSGQVTACQRVAFELAGSPDSFEVVKSAAHAELEHTIRITYRLGDARSDAETGAVTCTFGGGGFDDGRLSLVRVETSDIGPLTPAALAFLQRRLNLR